MAGQAEADEIAINSVPRLVDASPAFDAVVNGTADLSVTGSTGPASIARGRTGTYSLQVANNGPDTARSCQVTFTIGSIAHIVGATPSAGSCSVASPQKLVCQLGNVAKAVGGSHVTVSVVVQDDAAGTLTGTVGASSLSVDPVSTNNTKAIKTTLF
jgi:hypothetical protein